MGEKMIRIQVKALTSNAFDGLKKHYAECDTWRTRSTLKAHGVKQTLNMLDHILTINYNGLLIKIQNKLGVDYKDGVTPELKEHFIKTVDEFMMKSFVKKTEYEVTFEK